MTKMNVAFLVDDLQADFYVNELIQFVYTNEEFATPILLTGYGAKKKKYSFLRKIIKAYNYGFAYVIKKILFKLFYFVIELYEKRIVRKKFPNYGKIVDICNLSCLNIIQLEGKWSKNNYHLSFTDNDLALLNELNLDCIIRCGSGIISGDILEISKFGMLSFHHGDNRVNRGGPSGFWEVLTGSDDSGFVIQKLNSELDGGDILVRGNLMTSKLWLLNHAHLLEKSNDSMKFLLSYVAKYKVLPELEGVRLHGNRLLGTLFKLLRYIFAIVQILSKH